MVTAVIAAPVPPPTIAAMPTIANAGMLMSAEGNKCCASAPKAPPRVAPMNSDGEKIPPDDPDPRLSEVAVNFADEQQRQEWRGADHAEQNILDRRIADAFDMVVTGKAQKRVHHRADDAHSDRVAQIGIAIRSNCVLGKMQAANEPGRADAHRRLRAAHKAART